MRRFAPVFIVLLAGVWVAALGGCSRSPSPAELGTFALHMTDAPGDFDAVNLVVEEVAAHRDEGTGWEVLNGTPGTYDLLALTNGVFAELAVASIPAGHYTQVRLKLGEGSTVVVGGVTHPLIIPSGLQSGLKLLGEFDVPAGGGFDLGLDFDAARSVIDNGDGTWKLQPTVRIMPLAAAGAVRGSISPSSVPAEVRAMQGGVMIAATPVAGDGTFQLSMLDAGMYDVTVFPWYGYRQTTVPGVSVSSGATTDVGVIELISGE